MPDVRIVPVFWGPKWSTPGDKISGLIQLYNNLEGSTYLDAVTEYTNGV